MSEQASSAPAGGIADTSQQAAPAAAPQVGELPASGSITLEQDFTDWLGSKGIKGLDQFKNEEVFKLAKSYRETERWATSAEKFALPKEGSPQEAWDALYNKIGRPSTPEGYKLPVTEGGDPKLIDAFKGAVFKSGVTQAGAENLYSWFNEQVNAIEAQQEADKQAAFNEQKAALQQEWGKDAVRNADLADRGVNVAIKMMGLEGKDADSVQEKLESALGLIPAAKFMMALTEISGRTSDSFEGDGQKAGGEIPQSAALAQKQIDALKQDRSFLARRANGDTQAIAKWNELHRIASGGGSFAPTM